MNTCTQFHPIDVETFHSAQQAHKVGRIHRLGTMDVCTKTGANPLSSQNEKCAAGGTR